MYREYTIECREVQTFVTHDVFNWDQTPAHTDGWQYVTSKYRGRGAREGLQSHLIM
jgi:hypothetical protein